MSNVPLMEAKELAGLWSAKLDYRLVCALLGKPAADNTNSRVEAETTRRWGEFGEVWVGNPRELWIYPSKDKDKVELWCRRIDEVFRDLFCVDPL